MASFRRSGSFMLIAIVALAVTTAVLAQTPSGPRFRSGVDLVALDVCVRDRTGGFLPALTASDFLVLEDRVPQPITFFSSEGQVPLTAVVLIDRSNSMIGTKIERAKAAALTFLQHLGPQDVAQIMTFDGNVQRIVPFGTDLAAATTLIEPLGAEGMTALFDAMIVGLRELQVARRASDGPRRQALIVLSDGEDSASRLTFEDVNEEAQRAGVLIYSISIRMDERDRSMPPLHEFAQLANDSGGRVVTVHDLTMLDAVYADIAAELRHMYRLAYLPTSKNDGRWRPVSVRVPGRDVRARTRSGYYAAKASVPRGERP